MLAPASAPLAEKGVAEFVAACQSWNADRFAAAADLFRQANTNSPASSTNFYWIGVAEFHRVLCLESSPDAAPLQKAAAKSREAAVAALSGALALQSNNAECHALLGTIYGRQIHGNILRAARLGRRTQEHLTRALELGRENPRVRYLLGSCRFHTAKGPDAYKEALDHLLAAEKLFTAEAKHPPAPLEPRWGHSDCLAFLGRTCETLGDTKSAEMYYRKTLTLHPVNRPASQGLARITKPKTRPRRTLHLKPRRAGDPALRRT